MQTVCKASNSTKEAKLVSVVGPEYWVTVGARHGPSNDDVVYRFYDLSQALIKYMQVASACGMVPVSRQ